MINKPQIIKNSKFPKKPKILKLNQNFQRNLNCERPQNLKDRQISEVTQNTNEFQIQEEP